MPAPTPPPRMQRPADAGEFAMGDTQPSGNTSAGAAPAPPQSSPGAEEDASNIIAITAAARRIAAKYPSAIPEVQAINNAVQQLQMKIMSVQPQAQVAAPPQ